MDWSAIALSLRLATATTAILVAIGLPLAAWLAFSQRRGRCIVDAIVALPVYITFVASTLAVDEVLQAPMPLIPGTHLIENYAKVLGQGVSGNVTSAPVGRMMINSLVTALIIPIGKIAISLLSAFAIVYFRFRFACSRSG